MIPVPGGLLFDSLFVDLWLLQEQHQHVFVGGRQHVRFLVQKTVQPAKYFLHGAGRLPVVLVNDRHAHCPAFVYMHVLEVARERDLRRFLRVVFRN